MNNKNHHNFQVLIHERALRKNLKKNLDKILLDTNNEKYLMNNIMEYLCGNCNKCGNKVSNLKYHRRYKNICYVCHKKYKP